MKSLRRRLFALAVAAAVATVAALAQQPAANPILILVSFDGWRWDYADRLPAPNLRSLARRGIRVKELVPSFPVLTFPNHYTIVTGLYPAHHGIVANVMRDPAIPDRFSMSHETVRDSRWWGGEPIWVTAARQGRRTAAMFWPGSEAEIHGIRPTYWRRFDGSLPASARVAQVLEWLALPESERPSFITLYFDDVDHAGHDYGPGTPQLRAAAAVVDGSLGTLLAGIERLGLQGRTTVAVSSDHGMASLSPSRVILLDDYIDPAAVEVLESGGFLALAPIDASPAGVEAIDSRLRHAHPHLRVFTQETIPARLHYTGNPRIAPIVGVADPGWTVTTRALRQGRVADGHAAVQAGSHGFDPASTVMHATFVTAGPDVRSGLVVPSLENVHLYNFLCAVLRIEPAPNDGDPERVSAWIRRSP